MENYKNSDKIHDSDLGLGGIEILVPNIITWKTIAILLFITYFGLIVLSGCFNLMQ